MPKTDDMASFKNCQKGLAAPFVIDADFDPITKKVYDCQPNNDKSYTKSYQKHKKTADMDTRLSVLMMISIVNQFRYIKEKILFMEKC